MQPRYRESTKPNPESSDSERQVEPFECTIRDPGTLSELHSIDRADPTWSSQWIACCLRSKDFRHQLDACVSRLRARGWDLVQVMSLDATPGGVRAELVLQQASSEETLTG